MRIIGGKHKGRKIQAPRGAVVRPTTDRLREAIFNILEHGVASYGGGKSCIRDARVLDAFCGTGALGLEALSRGADRATFLDIEPAVLEVCRSNVETLGETAHAELFRVNCLKPLRCRDPHSLVFLDPPYNKGLVTAGLEALDSEGWIAPGAVCVIETTSRETILPPSNYAVVDDRSYGPKQLQILVRSPDQS